MSPANTELCVKDMFHAIHEQLDGRIYNKRVLCDQLRKAMRNSRIRGNDPANVILDAAKHGGHVSAALEDAVREVLDEWDVCSDSDWDSDACESTTSSDSEHASVHDISIAHKEREQNIHQALGGIMLREAVELMRHKRLIHVAADKLDDILSELAKREAGPQFARKIELLHDTCTRLPATDTREVMLQTSITYDALRDIVATKDKVRKIRSKIDTMKEIVYLFNAVLANL